MIAGRTLKLSLLLASTMTIMAGAIVAPSLPLISEAFAGVPHVELLSRLILTLPALFITLFSSLAGYSVDRFGRRSMLLGSLLLYALAGTTGAYFNNLYLILLGRALLGITVAGNMITITTLIGDFLKGDERSRFIGYQGSFMAFGGVFFIILAGWLADVSWELPFWIYSFSLLVLVMCYFFVPEPKKELINPMALTGKPVLKNNGKIWFVMLMGFSGMALFYIIPAQVPFLLAAIEGVSHSMIGYAISASTLCGAVISFFYGRFRKHLSFQWIYAIAFMLFATGFILISFAEGYYQVIAGLLIAGLGTGLLFPNANLWMIQLAPDNKRGQLIGNLNMAVFLGQFISPLLVHPMVEGAGIQAAFFYPGLFMLAIAIAFAIQQWIVAGRRKASENR
jgi:MFS family permease